MRPLALTVIAGVLLVGCGDKGAGVAIDPTVKPPKAYDRMTNEEKIASIERSPMPDAEKQKQIAALRAAK